MFGSDMIYGIPGLLAAMVFHEYAHARVAVAMGDFTPRITGRLTLNPIAHIDPIGLLMLFFVQFGWAKPVMINPRNFKDWRRGDRLVSLAGPVANLVIAFVCLIIMTLAAKSGFQPHWFQAVMYLAVLYNINFAIFNMIPLPPLDGSKVLMSFLPNKMAYQMAGIERYSIFILIILMMTPFLGMVLIPLQRFILSLYSIILGIFF